MKLLSLVVCLPLILASCAGYQLGGVKPSHLQNIKSVNVPLFINDTLLIRADAYATNSAVDAIIRDGTYKIATPHTADAILLGRVSRVKFSQVSSTRTDTLASEELGMTVTIDWVLKDANDPSRILEQGKSEGTTRFFARGNLNIARTNALPDALRRATEAMTMRLADGF